MNELMTDYLVPSVTEMLDAMRVVNESGSKLYFWGGVIDYGVDFNEPCTEAQIAELEEKMGYSLPKDYKEFLRYTNGMNFSGWHVSSKIYSLDELYSYRECIESPFPDEYLVIADCAEGTMWPGFYMAEKGKQMVFVAEMGDEYFKCLNCDFRIFLDRFLVTYGAPYWEWAATVTDIDQVVIKDIGPQIVDAFYMVVGHE